MPNAPETKKIIREIYLSGNRANTFTIPIKMAKSKGLEAPTSVIVEEMDDGIFIRKLEVVARK